MKRLLAGVGIALLLVAYSARASAPSDRAVWKSQSRGLAQRIDSLISARLKEAKIQPGAAADRAQFARRLHIDLTGKIPNLVQLADWIDQATDSPTQREKRIDRLLESVDYANNFSHFWRSVLLQGFNQEQARPNAQFESWLSGLLTSNISYDKMAREVINGQGRRIFNPIHGSEPDKVAGAAARVFLGVKIECAQCHNHPFADWKRRQFWEFAAFFNHNNEGKQIKIWPSEKMVKAKFLTGEEPDWTKYKPSRETTPGREAVTDWMTSAKNPYFAKAAVDHVWQYFFGVSLIEPILEPAGSSPPAHPLLLEEMAKAFIASGFDLKLLLRAIVLTDAYRRSSVVMSQANKMDIEVFAKMPVRGMTPEQLFDSVCVATEFRDPVAATPPLARNGLPGRRAEDKKIQKAWEQFLDTMFKSLDQRTETTTSVLQALYVMNGGFINEQSRQAARQNPALRNTTPRRCVELLYRMVLSRLPRPSEIDKAVHFIEHSRDRRQAVADVCWALLNSSEFMLNH